MTLELQRHAQARFRIVEHEPRAVQLGHGGHQGQSEPGSRKLARLVEPHAPSEHDLALVGGNSGPVVLDDDFVAVPGPPQQDADVTAFGRELERIVEQIREGLGEQLPATLNLRAVDDRTLQPDAAFLADGRI